MRAASRRWWMTLALLLATGSFALLTGCGGEEKSETPEPSAEGVPSEGAPAEATPPAEGAPPPGAAPAPPAEPGMPPGPGGPAPGVPGAEAEGEAPPGAPPPQVAAVPQSQANTFRPLDRPTAPPPPPVVPPPPPPPRSMNLLPIRATLGTPLPPTEQVVPQDDRLPDVRTSGILWGPTVKAIIAHGNRNDVVRPGDTVDIETPGARRLTVISIGPEGVRLRNEATGRIYFAPLRRG